MTAPWPRREMCLRYAERTRLRRQSRPGSWVGSNSSRSHAMVSFLCSTNEHVRPPPNRASRFQSSELGKGRLGAMSSNGAKRIGMHPPAMASKSRREVGVSPAGTGHSLELRYDDTVCSEARRPEVTASQVGAASFCAGASALALPARVCSRLVAEAEAAAA